MQNLSFRYIEHSIGCVYMYALLPRIESDVDKLGEMADELQARVPMQSGMSISGRRVRQMRSGRRSATCIEIGVALHGYANYYVTELQRQGFDAGLEPWSLVPLRIQNCPSRRHSVHVFCRAWQWLVSLFTHRRQHHLTA